MGYFLLVIPGPLSANMGLFIAPRDKTSRRSSVLKPLLSARARPSQNAPAKRCHKHTKIFLLPHQGTPFPSSALTPEALFPSQLHGL